MSEPVITRKRKRTSSVWNFYIPKDDYTEAECKECHKFIKTNRGGTTGLIRHLESTHPGITGNKRARSLDFNQLEFISKLAAKNGLSFNSIATCDAIQDIYRRATEMELPTSPSTIRASVLKYFEDTAKATTIANLANLKRQGQKFSLTVDEWTSSSNRRYMNVNVTTESSFWNLGLVRIKGSFTSEACLDHLTKRIGEYELSLNDVIGISTDGASVMRKFGRISGRNLQLCFAHGIHLAVVDVLYKKQQAPNNSLNENNDFNDPAYENSSGESENDDDFDSFLQVQQENEIEYTENISGIIQKVRKIVKSFKSSHKKTEVLEANAVFSNGSGLKLILDTRTRWNSLLDMLERFYKLKGALQKTFIDLGEQFDVSEDEFGTIQNIVHVLSPVKAAADAICRRNATLIHADVAITFLLNDLTTSGSELSKQMLNAIKIRVLQRRTILSDVLNYLKFGDQKQAGYSKGYFTKLNERILTMHLTTLYETYCTDVLRLPMNVEDAVIREMNVFQLTGERGKILQFIYQMLITIKPSTVESERVFSNSSFFSTKICSKLGDDSLNALVCLRTYFRNCS